MQTTMNTNNIPPAIENVIRDLVVGIMFDAIDDDWCEKQDAAVAAIMDTWGFNEYQAAKLFNRYCPI